jgi:RNA polymerase sigma-70 factor (ECF subfamily)
MTLERSENKLVVACQHGDREAFRCLFETYKQMVFSIALRFSDDRSVAMDIAQDTFLKLFSSIRDFRGDSRFESWVYRLVVNCCLDHRRRTRHLIPMADEFLGALRAPADSFAELARAELHGRVRSAVDRLSADLRIAVVLRYTEDLSYDEIAAALGCAPGTVASRLNRAHKILHRRLAIPQSRSPSMDGCGAARSAVLGRDCRSHIVRRYYGTTSTSL